MKITWEDRKNIGLVDDEILIVKPEFSFDYAWFLVTNETAQFVATHKEGIYNEDMSEEMRVEVLDFYNNYVFKGKLPIYNNKIEKIVQVENEIIDGKIFTKFIAVPFTQQELNPVGIEVPSSISPRQARLQLIALGKIDLVDPTIGTLNEPEKSNAKVEWEYATRYDIAHPYVIQMLSLLEIDINEFFIAASKL